MHRFHSDDLLPDDGALSDASIDPDVALVEIQRRRTVARSKSSITPHSTVKQRQRRVTEYLVLWEDGAGGRSARWVARSQLITNGYLSAVERYDASHDAASTVAPVPHHGVSPRSNDRAPQVDLMHRDDDGISAGQKGPASTKCSRGALRKYRRLLQRPTTLGAGRHPLSAHGELQAVRDAVVWAASLDERHRRGIDFSSAPYDDDGGHLMTSMPQGFTGHGTRTLQHGAVHVGDFVRSDRHGSGRTTWPDGRSYTGEWQHDQMHGDGTYEWADGRRYVGSMRHDELHGPGRYEYGPGGAVFVGRFRYDHIDGHGVFTAEDGTATSVVWRGVHPLDAVFQLHDFPDEPTPVSGSAADSSAVVRRGDFYAADPRTVASAVALSEPASLLTDPGVDPQCVVCHDAVKTRAVVPCGHLCLCGPCADTGRVTLCPLCRVPVELLLELCS